MKIHLFVVPILISTATYSQTKKEDSLRSQNIKSYKNYFYLWPVIQQRSTSFDIVNQDRSNPKLTYKPNGDYSVGIGAYIFKVSFEASLSVPPASEKEKLYGHSSSSDYQFNLLSKRWGVNGFAQNYNGFYQTDSDKPVPAGVVYPQRPDISTWNTGVNGIYIFNSKRYSLRAAYNFSERQLKSGGSFLLTGTINTFSFRADSGVYGHNYESIYGAKADFSKLDLTTFSVAPGYGYTLVVKNLFLNGSLAIGPAQHWIYYRSDAVSSTETKLNSFIDLRLSIGYNSDRFFGGVSFVAQSRNVKIEQVQFTSTSTTFRMLVGYRFQEFGILKKSVWDFIPFKKKDKQKN
ncbi:MAG: DUF4421 family protein [Cyclobacteriaceae bacterium]